MLRGARRDELPAGELAEWRDADLAMAARAPNDALCQSASRLGVLLVAQLDHANVQEIERLARWPAVGMVVLPAGATVDLAGLRHNLLLAEDFGAGTPIAPSRWADVVICDVRQRNDLTNPLGTCSLPILASDVDGRAFSSADAARAGLRSAATRADWPRRPDELRVFGLHCVKPVFGNGTNAMNADEPQNLDRYVRQMRYAPLGEQGQRKLAASRALICGCGALGSVIARYAHAGRRRPPADRRPRFSGNQQSATAGAVR